MEAGEVCRILSWDTRPAPALQFYMALSHLGQTPFPKRHKIPGYLHMQKLTYIVVIIIYTVYCS